MDLNDQICEKWDKEISKTAEKEIITFLNSDKRKKFDVFYLVFLFWFFLFAAYILLIIEVRKTSRNQRLWELEHFLEIINPSLYSLHISSLSRISLRKADI